VTVRERITAEHVAHWKEHGFVIVEGFLDDDELAAARAGFARHYPTWEEYRDAPDRYRTLGGWREFPFADTALNNITTHPALIDFVSSTLGTDDVLITQALLWAKYAGVGDWDQRHHMDYGNNTLVVPRDDGEYRQVPMILYYTDVTLDLGPTCVVSQQVRADRPLWPLSVAREDGPELYEHEVPVAVPAGSLMLYTMQTFHRGTAMTAAEGARFSHHIVWRRAGFEWMGWRAFPREGNDPNMAAWLEQATPRQRSVVGFPPPGHPYWTDETVAGVAARYPGMDMSPYRPGPGPG
jgi:ectoine hydroxylase-related dioxygenase (phytanoyl-CoA dioxygenase family)